MKLSLSFIQWKTLTGRFDNLEMTETILPTLTHIIISTPNSDDKQYKYVIYQHRRVLYELISYSMVSSSWREWPHIGQCHNMLCSKHFYYLNLQNWQHTVDHWQIYFHILIVYQWLYMTTFVSVMHAITSMKFQY